MENDLSLNISTHFDMDCWLAENDGQDLVIPMGKSKRDPDATYSKSGCLQGLRKYQENLAADALVPETYYYDSSMAAGIDIYTYIAGSDNVHITLVAQTQSGKTSVAFATFTMVKIHHPTSKHMVYISMPADKDLAKQSGRRLKPLSKVVVGRGCLSNIYLNAVYWYDKWSACNTEDERRKVELDALTVQAAQGNDWLAAPVIFDNTVLFLDESHFGAQNTSQINRVLELWGVPLNKDPVTWERSNVKIVTSSATPHAEVASLRLRPWSKKVIMRPGKGYIGLPEMLAANKIMESWTLKTEKDVERLVGEVIEPHLLTLGTGYGLIRRRTRRRGLNLPLSLERKLKSKGFRVKKGIPKSGDERQYDVAIIEYDQASRDQKMDDFLTTPAAKVVSNGKWLSNQPPIPTIILVKEKCKLGDTVSNQHVKFVFERISVKKNDPAFHEQSLAGRMTGYETHIPMIYSHTPSIVHSCFHIISGYQPETTPNGAKYVKTKSKRGYPAMSLTLDLSKMSDEELSEVLCKGRAQSLQGKAMAYKAIYRESLEASSGSLKEKLKSIKDKRGRRYSMWNWDDADSRSYVHPEKGEEIQQNSKYMSHGNPACVFVDKEGDSNTLKVSWYFAKDEVTVKETSLNNKSMYAIAAK